MSSVHPCRSRDKWRSGGWAELSSPLAWRLETAVTDRSAGEWGCRQHGGIAGTLYGIYRYLTFIAINVKCFETLDIYDETRTSKQVYESNAVCWPISPRDCHFS